MRIGEFGVDRDKVEEDTFTWFGVEVRVNDEGASDLAFMDFMEQATSVDEESAEAVLVVKQYLRDIVHPDDFDEFWSLARGHRQTTQDLMGVAAEVVAAVVGRPSQPSSGSPDGSSPTGPRSQDGSYSRAMDRLSGRPDLQLAVVRSEEAREAKAS